MKNITINTKNYQEYALEYLEDDLPDELKKSFELFLNKNEKIKDEINNLLDFYLENTNLKYFDKINLKKSGLESLSYAEYLFISDVEKTITKKEKNILDNLLKSKPILKETHNLFASTKLSKPDISYPNKDKLEKNPTIKIAHLWKYAAAILIIFIAVHLSNIRKNGNDNFIRQATYSTEQYKLRTSTRKSEIDTKSTIISYKNIAINTLKAEINQYEITDTSQTTDYTLIADNLEIKELKIQLSQIEKPAIVNNYTTCNCSSLDIVANDIPGIQRVVDFILKPYNYISENNIELKIGHKKSEKCYDLIINETAYKICLEDNNKIKKHHLLKQNY